MDAGRDSGRDEVRGSEEEQQREREREYLVSSLNLTYDYRLVLFNVLPWTLRRPQSLGCI